MMETRSPEGNLGRSVRHNCQMFKLWAFVKLSRPHFLLGGALMFAVGARAVGVRSPAAYILGQVMVSSAQLTAHYVNEYADVDADAGISSRTLFSGGSGVLSSGLLSPTVAFRAARVTSVVAIIAAAVIVEVSVAAALMGLAALAVSWTYSMPPTRLLQTGYGEFITSVVVTVFVPLVGGLSQSTVVPAELVWIMAALLPVHLAMMLCFELPDLVSDDKAGKTVLAVRLGEQTTRRIVIALLAGPNLVVGIGISIGGLGVGSLGPLAVAAIPAGLLVWSLGRDRPAVLTSSAVLVLVVLGAGLSLVS